MSAYETVIDFYAGLHTLYHWTQQEIDESELLYLMDLMIVKSKSNTPDSSSYIDDHF